jgi:hypothetical protein
MGMKNDITITMLFVLFGIGTQHESLQKTSVRNNGHKNQTKKRNEKVLYIKSYLSS